MENQSEVTKARSGFSKWTRKASGPLGLGIAGLWISVIVLLPLAAITVHSFDNGWSGFIDDITSEGAVKSLLVTIEVSLAVSIINVVMGTIIAWVLVRDEFPGKRIVNALIDLPFALPTIVASLVLLSLYGPHSPINLELSATKPALIIALAFVTLPFVVRQVQPVLLEVDRSVEEAGASLGASNSIIWWKILFPSLAPAIFSGAGLAFTRAIGEFGSVVLIGGNIPGETQVASQYIQKSLEIDDQAAAAAVSLVLLLIAFLVLIILRLVGRRAAHQEVEQ